MSKTPVSAITMYDGLEPAEAVRRAWIAPGRQPTWHEKCKDEVRQSMPLLARALDRLADQEWLES